MKKWIALALFAFVTVGAVTTAVVTAPSAAAQTSGALAAPTPREVSVHINAAQDGQIVHVRVNQRFAVELVGVPTAGYQWMPVQMPAFLTRAGDRTGPTIAAQNQPGYTGGNHWEVLMFAALEAGSGELVFVQRRPWERDAPPAHTFRVTIVAG